MLNKLYNAARPVPESLKLENKYTFMSDFNIVEVKYLDINDVLKSNEIKLERFITEYEQILLFPNKIGDTIVDIVVRSVNGKGHLKLGNRLFPYNIGNLSPNFKYGDTLYLVEGIGDLVMLKLFNPDTNVISMQSSKLSKDQIDLVSDITNNIVLIRDNDEPGEIGAKHLLWEFSKRGINFEIKNQFGDLKDTGDVLDLILKNKKEYSQELVDRINLYTLYYQNILK